MKEFFPQEKQELNKCEFLSGNETAKIAEKAYTELGSELGCRLVEPNVVLTLSGMKGQADIHWINMDKENIEKLRRSELKFEKLGLKIVYPKKLKKDSTTISIAIINFKGMERKSKSTKILGIRTYENKMGAKGFNDWYGLLFESLEQMQEEGKISKEVDLQVVFEGLILGYPDQAILDFEKCLREGDIHKDLIESDISSVLPEAQKYQGAVPEFYFYLDHKNDIEIVDYIKKAKQVLCDFYKSDWFKNIEKDQEFLLAREKIEKNKKSVL